MPGQEPIEGFLTQEAAALFSTRKVLEMVESLARRNEKKLFVVLSHSRRRLMGYLQGQGIWHRDLLDYLESRSYPVVDLRNAHLAEYQSFQLTPEQYKDRYYVGGHYNPAGNFFTAVALKQPLAQWLDPLPRTYR